MREFMPLDYSLMLSGCKIFTSGQFTRPLNVLLVISMLLAYVHNIWNEFNKPNILNEVLFRTMLVADTVCGSLFILVMNRNRDKFREILTQSQKFLTLDQKKHLTRHAIISLLIQVTAHAEDAVKNAVHLRDASMDHIISDSLEVYVRLNGWYVTGILSFSFFVKIIRFREENYFSKLRSAIRMNCDNKVEALIRGRRQETQVVRDILSAFSLIPCLWFGFIFTKVTTLLEQNDKTEDPIISVLRAQDTFILIGLMVYVINLCGETTAFTKSETESLAGQLVQNERMDLMLVSELEKGVFSFKVCSLFEISRSFGLSLLSALISFTVLFIQLTNEWKKKPVRL